MEQASAHIPRVTTPAANPTLAGIGIRLVGLDATPTGTDASADVVADFTGSTQVENPPSGVTSLFTVINSQTLGTTIRFNAGSEGRWKVKGTVVTQTAATVFAGLSYKGNAASLNTNPLLTNPTVYEAQRRIAAAADTDTMSVEMEVEVTPEDANSVTNPGIVRLLLSNGGDAGAAAASLVLTACALEISYAGPRS